MNLMGPDMPRAIVNGTVVAESDEYEIIEGNVYFPPDSIKRELFKESTLHSTCPWKGVASYYTLAVNGIELPDIAWYYPRPAEAASNIQDHVAFYPEVMIEMDEAS
jgi:uncharacterized protein (DUF427 family)